MKQPAFLPTQWPENIYYVCNSTFGGIVNAIPIIHAGPNRVVGMQVFCGVQNTGRPTSYENRQSVTPAGHLERFAKARGITVSHRVYANPDSVATWSDALRNAVAEAKNLHAKVVYNVTGGTKDMVLGALLGLRQEERASIMMISVTKEERDCVQLIFNDGVGALEEWRLERSEDKLTLDELLDIYGYVEVKRDERLKHECFIRRYKEIGKKVFDAMREVHPRVLGALHQSANRATELPCSIRLCDLESRLKSRRNASRLGNISDNLRTLINAFGGLEGLEVNIGSDPSCDSVLIRTKAAQRFVGGIWLEAVVLGLVEAKLSNRAILAAGLTLAVSGSQSKRTGSPVEDMEVDIAIIVDGQLHAVEVKAITTLENFGQYTPKLIKLRDEIGSHRMRAFLVAPLLNAGQVGYEDFKNRSEKQGVSLLYGLPDSKDSRRPDALGILEKELDKL